MNCKHTYKYWELKTVLAILVTALLWAAEATQLICLSNPTGGGGDNDAAVAIKPSHSNFTKGHKGRWRKLLDALTKDSDDSAFRSPSGTNVIESPAGGFQTMPYVVSPNRNGTSALMSPSGISTVLPRRGGGYNVLSPNGAFTSLSPRPGGGYNIVGADGTLFQMSPRGEGSYNLIGPNGVSGSVLPRQDGGYNIIDGSGNWSTIIPSPGTKGGVLK